jgi:hypothetical protein
VAARGERDQRRGVRPVADQIYVNQDGRHGIRPKVDGVGYLGNYWVS